MKKYTIYNSSTGEITRWRTVPSDYRIEGSYIEGLYDPAIYYISNGLPILKPTKPPGNYTFNYSTLQWELVVSVETEDSVRRNRSWLLGMVDRVNPVWYSTLTPEQQLELQTYRQALLDVPQQSGFPQSVSWPTVPSWLQ